MKKRLLLLCSMAMMAMSTLAQLRIDINNTGRNPAEGTEPGFEPWTFGRVPSAEETFTDANGNAIKVTMSYVEGMEGNAIRTNYWKQGVVDKGYKLLGDMAVVGYMDGNGNNFDELIPSKGFTNGGGIQLVVEGLAAGEHTLLAYHNVTDGYTGELPPVDVKVDGTVVSTGNPQTIRATKPSESGFSYIHFTVAEGKAATIQYISRPQSGVDYSFVGVAVNAMVFDEGNPITSASDPVPLNYDTHVNADNGTILLEWKGADIAVRHHVMVGTAKDDLKEVAVLTDCNYELTDVYSLNPYYWRIDEEDANGQVYEGEVWYFQARHLAFPGAEGYGRFAAGGRGGDVYHVTSLADDKIAQPGTLRYGIETATGPRTIVFDVAGFIDLKQRLTVSQSNITIAGQTAPGRGITLIHKPFGGGSDGIIRFVRLRLGGADDWNGIDPNPNTADGMGLAGARNTIVDHCSISWSIDEGFSSRNARDISFQKNMIAEALTYAGHATQYDRHGYHVQHGYAASIGGEVGSFHHNLLAHNQGRNWSMATGVDNAGNMQGKLDLFNNVCYNWWDRTTDGGSHYVHFVNNYYQMGPDTKNTLLFSLDFEGGGTPQPDVMTAYVSGNIRVNKDGSKTQDKQNVTYRATSNGGGFSFSPFADAPFWDSEATIHTAEDAFKIVLSDVGCNSPEIDNHDIRMIQETLTQTTSKIGWHSKLRGLIDRESESEGFAGLNIIEASRPAGYDTDLDGMPDWWEALTGSDRNTADNNDDPDRDGYTLLEDYLNWLADTHRIMGSNDQQTISLQTLFAGFTKSPAYDADVVSGDAQAVISNGNLVIVTNGAGLSAIDVTVTDSDGTTMTRRVNIAATGNGEATAIDNANDNDNLNANRVYDLQGRRMESSMFNIQSSMLKKGVYIVNGKKYIQ